MNRKKMSLTLRALLVLLGTIALFEAKGFSSQDEVRPVPTITPEMVDSMKVLPGGLAALPEVKAPADNPQSPAKIELGKRLFFDTRLSLDQRSSCATCHDPAKAFTDGLPRAKGFKDVTLRRNSPTVLNAAFNDSQFWDGRAATLDEQCKGPLLSKDEMNMLDEEHLVARLSRVKGYRQDFQSAFGSGPTLDNVARAIAAFERTLVTPGSRFDQYVLGEKSALTVQEKRGLILFFGKGNCSECHKGVNFTDNKFHNLGLVPAPGAPADLGRFAISNNPEDKNAFKTPTLRNIALTGPYMHDGSSPTLEDVIDLYDRGGGNGPNKDKLIYKLNLSAQKKADLVAFLKALTGNLPPVQAPAMYPMDGGPGQ